MQASGTNVDMKDSIVSKNKKKEFQKFKNKEQMKKRVLKIQYLCEF